MPNLTASKRYRLALLLLILADGLSLVGVGLTTDGIDFSLRWSALATISIGADALFALGLFFAKSWAIELTRYRCILAVGYICFLWIVYVTLTDVRPDADTQASIMAAVIRDCILGVILSAVLFVLRENK